MTAGGGLLKCESVALLFSYCQQCAVQDEYTFMVKKVNLPLFSSGSPLQLYVLPYYRPSCVVQLPWLLCTSAVTKVDCGFPLLPQNVEDIQDDDTCPFIEVEEK